MNATGSGARASQHAPVCTSAAISWTMPSAERLLEVIHPAQIEIALEALRELEREG